MYEGPRSSRLRRFVQVYGWRAYAVPVLAVVTLLALVDVAQQESSADQASVAGSSASSSAVTSATASSGAASATSTVSSATPGGEPEQASTAASPPAPSTDYVQRGAGTLRVVDGASQVLGNGPLLRFRVEVENGIDLDAQAFAGAVATTLSDPRSWGAGARQSFQRVSDGPYDFRVLLVSPDNVNSFCPGLDTGGYTSCRSGDHAVLNLARWMTGVPDYAGDLATYRQYVVNHEVGHYLGNGHELCPGPGERAPVMQQQTLGLEGCLKNPWPYPDAG